MKEIRHWWCFWHWEFRQFLLCIIHFYILCFLICNNKNLQKDAFIRIKNFKTFSLQIVVSSLLYWHICRIMTLPFKDTTTVTSKKLAGITKYLHSNTDLWQGKNHNRVWALLNTVNLQIPIPTQSPFYILTMNIFWMTIGYPHEYKINLCLNSIPRLVIL